MLQSVGWDPAGWTQKKARSESAPVYETEGRAWRGQGWFRTPGRAGIYSLNS